MKKIMFTGGGTLGHYSPNEAIYQKLKDKYICEYIGSKNGIEKEFASKLMPYHQIETVKLDRTKIFKNFFIPFKLIKGIFEAKKILKQTKPDIVFSKGGFVSVPVVIAGHMLKIPCITHESDFTLGLANRIIAKKCKYVCTSFEETSKSIKNGYYTGSIVRQQIFEGKPEIVAKKYKLDPLKKTILIVGGSLGAENLNYAIRKSLNKLTNYNILHLTGKGKIDNSIKFENYHQIEFASDIQNYFCASDIVITRGGSNTIFEILALKKPMIIVPLASGRGDQILNAQEFAKKGYAEVLQEKDISDQSIFEIIKKVHINYKQMQQNMQKFEKDGLFEICKIIKNLLENQKKS